MPLSRARTTLDFIRPDGPGNPCECRRLRPVIFTAPELFLGTMEMLKPLFQVIPIPHGERDQEGLEMWLFRLDDFKFIEVGSETLRPAPDRAQRAQEMLFAEAGTMEPNPIDRKVMTKNEVVPATLNLGPHRLMFWDSGHIIGNVDCSFLCLAVTINFFR